jgi:glutamyl-tRNA synthetase
MTKKVWKEDTSNHIQAILEIIRNVATFTSASLEKEVHSYLEKTQTGFGKVATPLRLLIVGSGTGPHLFDIMDMIGKEETMNRIQKGLKHFAVPDPNNRN